MRRQPPSRRRRSRNDLPLSVGGLAAFFVLGSGLFGDRFDGVGIAALVAGAAASFAWVVLATVRAEGRERRARKNRCRACGYSRTGNVSGVCPECGARHGTTGRTSRRAGRPTPRPDDAAPMTRPR